MLLSNLTKSQHIIKKLIPADLPSSSTSLIEVRTKHLDNLLEVFVRGATPHASSSPSNRASDAMENTTNKTKNQDGEEEEEEEEDESGTTTTTGPLPKSAYNKHANFHFLASVFANVSATPGGAQFLLGSSTVDGAPRLDRLVIFLNHTDLIRRGGVVSVFKNVCFDVEAHPRLLGDGGSGEEKKKAEEVGGEKTTTTTTSSTTATGILSYLLLPLMGPEEYDDEVNYI